MADRLKIDHVAGRVEARTIDAEGKDTSGVLVMAKPDEFDSLSEAELRAKLPSLGSRSETTAAKEPVKPKKARKKK